MQDCQRGKRANQNLKDFRSGEILAESRISFLIEKVPTLRHLAGGKPQKNCDCKRGQDICERRVSPTMAARARGKEKESEKIVNGFISLSRRPIIKKRTIVKKEIAKFAKTFQWEFPSTNQVAEVTFEGVHSRQILRISSNSL